jgi:hypothetical protein
MVLRLSIFGGKWGVAKRVPVAVLSGVALLVLAVAAIVVLLLAKPEPIPVVEAKVMPPLPQIAAPVPQPKRRVAKPVRLVGDWEEYVTQGKDKEGKVAFFRVLILPGDFRWAFASQSVITDADGKPMDLSHTLKGDDMRNLLGSASHIIAVGAASIEGDLENEEARAEARARQLASWVRPRTPRSARVYTLNLGRYLGSCQGCSQQQTSAQRRVVVITVSASHPGVDISTALRNALLGTSEFPLKLSDYSSFELQRITSDSLARN